jgi:hypothetical protein
MFRYIDKCFSGHPLNFAVKGSEKFSLKFDPNGMDLGMDMDNMPVDGDDFVDLDADDDISIDIDIITGGTNGSCKSKNKSTTTKNKSKPKTNNSKTKSKINNSCFMLIPKLE